MSRFSALLLAALLLAGCAETTAPDNVQEAVQAAADAVAVVDTSASEAATTVAQVATPATLAVREIVESIPSVEAIEVPTQRNTSTAVDSAAVALVVRWEVGSKDRYTKLYQGVICPGGASGPTIGIGDDLGHQTQAEIRRRWGWHPQVDRLVTGSGVTGDAACKAWRKSHLGIRVSYDDAIRVFTEYTWPSYLRMAERAYRNGWKELSLPHQGGLGSNGYNRGFSMVGARNTEKRHTRDVCVPANDSDCTAADLIASCRVWDNQPTIRKGLCARRHDEAKFVRS